MGAEIDGTMGLNFRLLDGRLSWVEGNSVWLEDLDCCDVDEPTGQSHTMSTSF